MDEGFDPAAVIAAAAAKRNEGTATATSTAAPRRKRRPQVDPHERVPFNSKTPRWVRSATRAFADEENEDLQDLHAAALVLLMRIRGFDVDSYRPDSETSPVPKHAAKLDALLAELPDAADLHTDETAEKAS